MPSKPKPPTKEATAIDRRIRLRIICQKPPDREEHGAIFGLQDNSTTKEWVIHAGKTRANGEVHFEFECRVKPLQSTGAINFLGDFVHGVATKRFVYLSWRPKDWSPGQPEPATPVWVRRMKVHLSTISWAQINDAAKRSGVLEATVVGTGRGGGPNCGTVPLIGGGWKVTNA